MEAWHVEDQVLAHGPEGSGPVFGHFLVELARRGCPGKRSECLSECEQPLPVYPVFRLFEIVLNVGQLLAIRNPILYACSRGCMQSRHSVSASDLGVRQGAPAQAEEVELVGFALQEERGAGGFRAGIATVLELGALRARDRHRRQGGDGRGAHRAVET